LEDRHSVERLAARLHRRHETALTGEEVAEHLTDLSLIVDDQHTGTRRLQVS
jgi:hypothetical protein